MPLSMMSAFNVGRYSVAIVCTNCSATTASSSERYGRRYDLRSRGSMGVVQGGRADGGVAVRCGRAPVAGSGGGEAERTEVFGTGERGSGRKRCVRNCVDVVRS